MKLTTLQADNYLSVLNSVSDKITGKLAYVISRNIRKLITELQEYTKIKNDVIIKYGEKKCDGNYSIKIDSEAYDKYIEEISQYNDMEIDVEIMSVRPDYLFDSQLTASEMLALDFMIMETKNAESISENNMGK